MDEAETEPPPSAGADASGRARTSGPHPAGEGSPAGDEAERGLAALRESEERFAKAFNASPLILTITSLTTGRLVAVNDTFCAVSGYRREEALGRTSLELGLWARPADRKEVAGVRRAGRLRNVEYRFRTRRGGEIVGLLSAETIEIGGDPCVLTVVADITERKRMEEALAETNRRLQLALDGAALGTWSRSAATGEVAWDDRTHAILGLPPDSPRTGEVFDALVHPDDHARISEAARRALETGEAFTAEFRIVPAGEVRWVVARAMPQNDPRGAPPSLTGVIMDVTKLREAEAQRQAARAREQALAAERDAERQAAEVLARVSAALARSLDPHVVVGQIVESAHRLLAGAVAFVHRLDPATGNLVAVARAGDPEFGWRLGDVIPPGAALTAVAVRERRLLTTPDVLADDRVTLPASHRAAVEDARHRAVLTVPLVAQDRVLGAFTVNDRLGRPFSPKDVALAQALADAAAVALDNAERYRAEQATRADAEASNRAKDEFLAMLGHELRNPLGAIASAAGVLEAARGNEVIAERARRVIRQQLQHLSQLMDDLLEAGRIATGKIALSCRPLDLAEAVEGCLAMLQAAGRTRHHVVERDLAPLWVHADATRIEQIVANLVGNALKYTPRGGRVTVTLAPDGDRAVLRVADTGSGISAALLPRVFDLFVQGDRRPDRAEGGLGIGLTVVKRLAELHGGDVTAESPGPGRGSTFTMRMPRIPPPFPAAEPRPAREGRAAVARIVLVVEDNADAREMLRLALELAGHTVDEAEDGPGGVAAAAARVPDVAVVDLGLPRMDGCEVARRIRALPGGRRPLLIALTGYGQAADRERAAAAGFDAHLTKPIDPARLIALIADAAGP